MAKSVFRRDFLQSARNVRNSGGATPERSFYAALSVLLNGIGDALKPKVTVVMEMKNQGAGNPDGGLFTEEQFDRKTLKLKDAQSPNRGVIEVKSPAEPVGDISKTTQIEKYWHQYRLVLVTNLRDWQLIGERDGNRVTLERFELATNESEFWALAEHPDVAQKKLGEAFEDFLSRVLLHKADIADPKDLAALLLTRHDK